jgi:hypothetical protein
MQDAGSRNKLRIGFILSLCTPVVKQFRKQTPKLIDETERFRYIVSKRKKDEAMEMIAEIKRVNHVAKLCKTKGWSKARFVKEAVYHTNVSDRTLEKVYDGATNLDLDTVEQLAKLFDVTKDEVLESVW